MNLQTLTSIDLPSLSRSELVQTARAIRADWVKTVNLRAANSVILEYVESYKNELIKEAVLLEQSLKAVEKELAQEAALLEEGKTKAVLKGEDALVVFHQKSPLFHCPDGALAGIIAKDALEAIGLKVKLVPGMYSNNEEVLEAINASPAKSVYMVDYSLPPSLVEQVQNKDRLVILDHHQGAEQDYQEAGLLNQVSGCLSAYFNTRKSGARLAWEYFNRGESVPYLVKYVEDGDLYSFALPHAKEVCAGIYSAHFGAGRTLDEIKNSLFPWWEMTKSRFISHYRRLGVAAWEDKQRRVEALAQTTRVVNILGRKAVAVEVKPTDLDIVSALCAFLYWKDWVKEGGLRFVAAYNYQDGKCYVSLRSGGYDCLPVAKHFGGSGHPRACGFSVSSFEECIDHAEMYLT